MELDALIAAFVAHGVRLRVEGGALRWRARVGVMTAELRAALEEHRAELTRRIGRLPERVADWPPEARAIYEERAGFGEFVGGLERAEAEQAAEALVRLWVARDGGGDVAKTRKPRASSLRVGATDPAPGDSRSVR